MPAVRLIIRPSGPSDAAAIVALVNGAYRGVGSQRGWTDEIGLVEGPRITAERLREMEKPRSVVLVAERRGKLAGCVYLEMRSTDECFLGMLSVHPAEQGTGLGKAIMADAERFARDEWKASLMAMHVIPTREELVAWYERRGYRRTGHRVSFDPPPGIRLLQGPLEFERLEKRLVP